MITFLDRLISCEQITEWVDPNDARLVAATGEKAPNGGGNVRDAWELSSKQEGVSVAREVGRLIIGDASTLLGEVSVAFTVHPSHIKRGWEGTGSVSVGFTDSRDWVNRFPTERSQIFNREGRQAWAAVALCSNQIGLAVFGMENKDGGVDARVQVVPDDVFEAISAS